MAERGRPRGFDKQAALCRAMELFWSKGYDGTSLTDLTEAMGIASASLYAAFGSKEELFRQALAHYSATEGVEIWEGLDRADTAFEAVRWFLMQTARVFTRRTRPSGCFVVLSCLHPDEGADNLRHALIAMRREGVTVLGKRLQQGVEAGEISPQADLDTLARYFVTVQYGMSVQARDGATRAQLEAVAAAALASWPALTQAARPAAPVAPGRAARRASS